MLAIRVQFKKEGRAKYISHLDLNRCMQRALRRASIPVWQTQGFNPHPYIVFAMPLSIFYESDCEIMDARLDGEMTFDAVKGSLADQMPEGIVINAVTLPQMKLADIGFAAYSVTLDFDSKAREELDSIVAGILARGEVIIEKSTKRSTIDINVKQYFESAKIQTFDGGIDIRVVLPAGSQENLNPSCIVAAVEKYGVAPDFERIRRLQIFNKDMQAFL
jgi:radical SAM-linked protein